MQTTDVIFNVKGLELMCSCNFTFLVFLLSVTKMLRSNAHLSKNVVFQELNISSALHAMVIHTFMLLASRLSCSV
jgi:hypothetical protein